MYLIFSKKYSDSYCKLLGWIAYIFLMANSFWFTWEVLNKFAKQDTAVRQYEEDNIEAHPTIAICNIPQDWNMIQSCNQIMGRLYDSKYK